MKLNSVLERTAMAIQFGPIDPETIHSHLNEQRAAELVSDQMRKEVQNSLMIQSTARYIHNQSVEDIFDSLDHDTSVQTNLIRARIK